MKIEVCTTLSVSFSSEIEIADFSKELASKSYVKNDILYIDRGNGLVQEIELCSKEDGIEWKYPMSMSIYDKESGEDLLFNQEESSKELNYDEH